MPTLSCLRPGVWFLAGEKEAAAERWKRLRGYNILYGLPRGSSDPTTHTSWKRFEEYASYVRAIALFAFDGPWWCNLCEKLVPCLGGRPVLPSLKRLPLAIAVSLVVKLDFTFREDYLRVHPAFSHAFSSTPNIEMLRLSMQPSEHMYKHCHRYPVRRIEVVPLVDASHLQILAKISHISSLRISIRYMSPPTNELTFPLLDTLQAKGNWTCLAALLNSIHAPELRELSLEAWEPGAPAQQVAKDATECLRAIPTKHPFLTRLAILASCGGPFLGGCAVESIPIVQDAFEGSLPDIIRPLLVLHDLRTLILILPNYLDVDCSSADFLVMSEAWRGIEALHIQLWEYFAPMGASPPGGDRPRGAPLAAVAHFARNCPSLKTLHLPPMDATQLELGEELSPSGHPAHGLQRLITSKVKIGSQNNSGQTASTNSVMEFVERVFPSTASAFRQGRVAVADGWLVAHENAQCLDCRTLRMQIRTF